MWRVLSGRISADFFKNTPQWVFLQTQRRGEGRAAGDNANGTALPARPFELKLALILSTRFRLPPSICERSLFLFRSADRLFPTKRHRIPHQDPLHLDAQYLQ